MERSAAPGLPQVRTNASAHGPLLEDVARPDSGGLALLRDAADTMRLSTRGYHRVLRVARTLGRPRRRREDRPAASGRGAVIPRAGGGPEACCLTFQSFLARDACRQGCGNEFCLP